MLTPCRIQRTGSELLSYVHDHEITADRIASDHVVQWTLTTRCIILGNKFIIFQRGSKKPIRISPGSKLPECVIDLCMITKAPTGRLLPRRYSRTFPRSCATSSALLRLAPLKHSCNNTKPLHAPPNAPRKVTETARLSISTRKHPARMAATKRKSTPSGSGLPVCKGGLGKGRPRPLGALGDTVGDAGGTGSVGDAGRG